MPSKHLGGIQSLLSHPAGFVVAFGIAAWELAHLFNVLWTDTPSWLKKLLVVTFSNFHPSVLLVFFVGVLAGAFGRRFLRAALIKILQLLPADAVSAQISDPDEGDSS